jgi:hypothetical protein
MNIKFSATLWPKAGLALLMLLLSLAAAEAAKPKSGPLHVPRKHRIRGTYASNDKNGCRWDIYFNYGTLANGTNNVYNHAMLLQLDGSQFGVSSRGYRNAAGNEVEVGPWKYKGLEVYRRIKIYKKEGLARWLDIYTNPTDNTVTLTARVRTQMNYGIAGKKSNSGKESFGPEDFAILTHSGGRNNTPASLHIPVEPHNKYRPRVAIAGNAVEYHYNLKIPAKKTIVVASFLAQNQSQDKLVEMMKAFKPYKYFEDLSPEVHKLIVNFNIGAKLFSIELPRSIQFDRVMLTDGDPIFGKVDNNSFPMQTAFGQETIPAEKVVGMVAGKDLKGVFQVVLVDGQVICGTLADQKLRLVLPDIGTQEIPLADIRYWSYQVSQTRPQNIKFLGPFLVLKNGDRLAYKADSVTLQLRTENGIVPLPAAGLLQIQADKARPGVHRVKFLNGSIITGQLEPVEFTAELLLVGKQKINRNTIKSIEFAPDELAVEGLSQLMLSSGDRLLGYLIDQELTLKNKYGTVKLNPSNLRSISRDSARPGLVKVTLWNDSVLHGELPDEKLEFQISPGPVIKIDPSQITSLVRSLALPPKLILTKVEKLVAQLGAESYRDRQAAQEELIRMGKTIIPILKKHTANMDPEIRQRIQEILDKLGAKK